MGAMPESSTDSVRPATVWSIFVILVLQGGAVILTTVGSMIDSPAQVLDAAGQIALVVLYILIAVVLILLGFRLLAGSAAARTPAMVLQLLIVVLSFSFFAGGAPLMGLVFLLPAGTVLVLLFLTPTQQWLVGGQGAL